ncbi:MAG: hypothetical protein PHT12_02365 [Patescibacteria group bacterium]|nr:hypothetical protein [Patescibacteria group bacterium]
MIKQRRAPAGTRRQTTIDVHVQAGQERVLMAKLGGSPIVAVVGAEVEATPVKLKPAPARESRALMRLQRDSFRLRGKGICR